MKFFISGASGYIGSALSRFLIEKYPTYRFILNDILPAPPLLQEKIQNTRHIDWIQKDITQFSEWKSLIESPDIAIHLAAHVDPSSSSQDSAQLRKVNLDATIRLAEFCQSKGIRLFFPSTTSIYWGSKEKIKESMEETIRPQTEYAKLKWEAEKAIQKLMSSKRYLIFRWASVFGANESMKYQTAIHAFCKKAALVGEINIWESAFHQLRPYLALEDLLALMDHAIHHDLFCGEIFHTASLHSTPEKIAAKIKSLIPHVNIKKVNHAGGSPESFELDLQKIEAAGFHSQGNLEEELPEIIRSAGSREYV